MAVMPQAAVFETLPSAPPPHQPPPSSRSSPHRTPRQPLAATLPQISCSISTLPEEGAAAAPPASLALGRLKIPHPTRHRQHLQRRRVTRLSAAVPLQRISSSNSNGGGVGTNGGRLSSTRMTAPSTRTSSPTTTTTTTATKMAQWMKIRLWQCLLAATLGQSARLGIPTTTAMSKALRSNQLRI